MTTKSPEWNEYGRLDWQLTLIDKFGGLFASILDALPHDEDHELLDELWEHAYSAGPHVAPATGVFNVTEAIDQIEPCDIANALPYFWAANMVE